MKKMLFFWGCYFCIHGSLIAQPLQWSWVANSTGNMHATGYCVASDPASDAIITGSYNYRIEFGNDALGFLEGNVDIFVAEYDSSGNPLWAETAGGTQND